jgi:hypothetical protein
MKAIHNTLDFFTNNMSPLPLSVIVALLAKAAFTCSSIISIRFHSENEKVTLVLVYEHFFRQNESVEFKVLFGKDEKLDQMTYLANMLKLLTKLIIRKNTI